MQAAKTLAVLVLLVASSAPAEDLRRPKDIRGRGAARSIQLFQEMGKVLTHARCVNCHPSGRRPLQGEAGELHQPPVDGGVDGRGLVGMRCAACHHTENVESAGVPGAANWHLAPASMGWAGRSLGAICRQLKDPSRNGGRPLDAIVKHLAEDPLVAWAWHPGADRDPAPGSQELLGALARAWQRTGAACPED